ncbi:hypothetical protein GCM10009759_24040 [Kitasatospora saccharophila]|uniref:4-amino-4-deoxy-L-arabinose transferase-like glycosyltransferase n=1 Tax=Kitasatospora saccharophila TaxID=407973 RepID=A0ABN2WML9_9ACTN
MVGSTPIAGSSESFGRRLRRYARPTPYKIAGLIFLLFMLPICARLPWSGDIGQHASTIWRLRENLGHPRSPMIDVPGDGSPYFSPYQVLGALVSLATGLVPLKVLHLLALSNMVVLVIGIGAFVRSLTTNRWAPVLALACYVFLWGVDVQVWSGYESLLSLSLGVSYPSAFAAGLMFLVWAWTLRLLGRVPEGSRVSASPAKRIPAHLAIGLLVFVIVLSHPFTGIPTCLGIVAIFAASLRTLKLRDWLLWVLSGAVLLVGMLAWPYWSAFDLKQSAALDAMHKGLYNHPLNWFGFALVLGIPALITRFRRDRLDPLVLLFALTAATVGYGYLSGHYSWGRVYPSLVLSLQFATALELSRIPGKQWFRQQFSLVATVTLVLGAWVQSGALFYIEPKEHWPKPVVDVVQAWNPWPGFQWTTKYLKYGDVVMTRGERPSVMLPAYGYYTVAAGYPDPAVSEKELQQRSWDSWKFFNTDTDNALRLELLKKYHAHWVLIRPQDGAVPEGPEFEVVARSPQGEYLIHVK